MSPIARKVAVVLIVGAVVLVAAVGGLILLRGDRGGPSDTAPAAGGQGAGGQAAAEQPTAGGTATSPPTAGAGSAAVDFSGTVEQVPIPDQIAPLIEQIQSLIPDEAIPAAALEKIQEFLSDRVLGQMVDRLGLGGPQRGQIIETTRKLMRSMIVRQVLRTLAERGANDRAAAARALATLGDRNTTGPLVLALFDEPWVSGAAADTLDKLDPQWRRGAAARRVADESLEVLATAAPGAALRQGGLWRELQTKHEETSYGRPVAVDREAEARTLRLAAVCALGHLRDTRAVEPLIALLADAELGQEGDPSRYREESDEYGYLVRFPRYGASLGMPLAEQACRALRAMDAAWMQRPSARKALDARLADLDSSSRGRRLAAVIVLAAGHEPRAVTPLAERLEDPDQVLRYLATIGLGEIGDPRAAEPLLKIFLREPPRPPGARPMMPSSQPADWPMTPASMPTSRPMYPSSGPADWQAESRPAYGGPSSSRPASDWTAASRPAAGGPTGFVRPDDFGPYGRTDRQSLYDWGEYAWRINTLDSQEILSRATMMLEPAAAALARLAAPQSVEPLVAEMNDPASGRRTVCCLILSRVADARATAALVAALGDPDQFLASTAALALGTSAPPEAAEPLIKALGSRYGGLRAAAAYTLGRMGEKRAVPALIERLEDSFFFARYNAMQALARLGDPRAGAAMAAMAAGGRWSLVLPQPAGLGDEPGAAPGWGHVGRPEELDEKLFEQLPEAMARVGGGDAVEALVMMGKPELLELHNPDWRAGPGIGEAADRLMAQVAANGEPNSRRAAIGLGLIRDARAVETLTAAVKRPDSRCRTEAILALGLLGDARAVPVLADLLCTGEAHGPAAAALLGIRGPLGLRDPAVVVQLPRLLKVLEQVPASPPSDPRQAEQALKEAFLNQALAADVLGGTGDRRAVGPLLARFNRRPAAPVRQPDPYRRADEQPQEWDPWQTPYAEAVRPACARALGLLKATEAADALRAELDRAVAAGPDGDVNAAAVREAVWALGEMADRRSVAPLLLLLSRGRESRDGGLDMSILVDRPSYRSSSRPMAAAGQPFVTGGRLVPLRSIPWEAGITLTKIGDRSVLEPLRKLLARPESRDVAAAMLQKMNDRDAVDPLLATLSDESDRPSEHVLDALAALDPQWRTRPGAKQAVGSLVARISGQRGRSRRSFESDLKYELRPLAAVLDGIDPDWRSSDAARAAVRILAGRLKGEGPVGSSTMSAFGGPESREAALIRMAAIGGEETARQLIPVVTEPYLGEHCEVVLDRIDPAWPQRPEAKALVPDCIRLLRENRLSQNVHDYDRNDWPPIERAVCLLVRFKDPRGVDALIDELIENGGNVYNPKRDTWGETPRPPLPYPDGYAFTVIKALAELCGPADVQRFTGILADASSPIRVDAAYVLGFHRDRAALPALAAALADADPDVRLAAWGALADGESTAEGSRMRSFRGCGFSDWPAAAEVRRVVPRVLALLQSAPAAQRPHLVRLLGAIGDARAVEPILATLKSSLDGPLKAACVRALGELGDPRGLPVLLALAAGEDASMREAADRALSWSVWRRRLELTAEGVKVLAAAIDGGSTEGKLAAVKLLGRAGGGLTFDALAAAAKQQDPAVRREAVSWLGPADEDRAFPVLVAMAADADPQVRSAVAYALHGRYGTKALPALLAMLKDSPWALRRTICTEFLARPPARGPQVVAALIELLREAVRLHASGRGAQDSDAAGAAAARLLGVVGDHSAAAALKELSAGAAGLGRLGSDILDAARRTAIYLGEPAAEP